MGKKQETRLRGEWMAAAPNWLLALFCRRRLPFAATFFTFYSVTSNEPDRWPAATAGRGGGGAGGGGGGEGLERLALFSATYKSGY